MTAVLVRLETAAEVTITHAKGGADERKEVVSRKALRAHLLLTPDGDPGLSDLGFVHLHVEASPRAMPDMTAEETKVWLCEMLTALLTEPDE